MNKVEQRFTTEFKIALFQLDVTPLFFAGPDVYQVSETSYKGPLQIKKADNSAVDASVNTNWMFKPLEL